MLEQLWENYGKIQFPVPRRLSCDNTTCFYVLLCMDNAVAWVSILTWTVAGERMFCIACGVYFT